MACLISTFLSFGIVSEEGSSQPLPPQGVVGSADNSGGILIEWVYHGMRDTTYRTYSGALSKAVYISREHAAHKLACLYVLSDDRQWITGASIWVQKSPHYTDLQWLEGALLRVSLCPDENGYPGTPLLRPLEYRPADLGILPTGGFLNIALDQAAPVPPLNSIWILIEWPPAEPDLVSIGVDDQSPTFRSLYADASQGDDCWETWVDHNPMVSSDCDLPGLPSESPEYFILERTGRVDGVVMPEEYYRFRISGDRTCLYDSNRYVNYLYEYRVRAVELSDSSDAARVLVDPAPPFECEWVLPETFIGEPLQSPCLPYEIISLHDAPLSVRFVAGWLVPTALLNASQSAYNPDSVTLWMATDVITVQPGQTGLVELFPDGGEGLIGSYYWTSIFEVSTEWEGHATYRFQGDVEFSETVGVTEEHIARYEDSVSVRIFPNPGHDRCWIEIGFPLRNRRTEPGDARLARAFGGAYTITAYDVLGRAINHFDKPIAGNNGETVRVLFDGNNKNGTPLPSGLYFIRVNYGRWSTCRKFILLR